MNTPVLVLNVNFEPINICDTRRAIGLILTGKAAMVINGRGAIYSVSQSFPRPSIIRLEYMVKRPRPRVKLMASEIFRRDNFTCQYCGRKDTKLTIDHIHPKRLGGKHIWENVVAACPTCNYRKGGKKLKETSLSLLKKPEEPASSLVYYFSQYLNETNEWLTFIEGW
ncbi:MAG: HNH endonuclease [Anaerolineae bacterium]|jgi:5-methylcytosine-specific restriction endonuclease McrA|nr:HNH endonuclease [Anaerolineae bacterium]MBT7073142.1 HNH endonuclease [Anaerolineae bacterium]MBT7326632.1 HNH endonuclease [Anaerolineae bacterium]